VLPYHPNVLAGGRDANITTKQARQLLEAMVLKGLVSICTVWCIFLSVCGGVVVVVATFLGEPR